MKRLTILAVLALITMASCEKTRCYQCTITASEYPDGRGPIGASTTTSYCDMTPEKIAVIEAAGKTTQHSGGMTIYTNTHCQ